MVIKTMPPRIQEEDTDTTNGENLSKEVLLIAQEIEIVRSLASNDLKKRTRQLKRLRKWLSLRSTSSFPFTEEDCRRIWKGLYYTMWLSDKPLVQEDLAEQLGKLLLCFKGNLEASTDFFGAFLHTLYQQWFGLDQWRIDKFMMLVRRMLRYMFQVLKDSQWSLEGIQFFNTHLKRNVFTDKGGAAGLTMHILDIFCDELAKVANGAITAEQVGHFIRPFVEFYCNQRDCNLTSHCRTRIFYHLLYQSTLGREYMEKYDAWKELGFPTRSINDLEMVEDTNEDDNNAEDLNNVEDVTKHLDPRAGNVDVFVPELPLDATCVIDEIENFLRITEANTKRRKQFRKLIEIYKTFQNGEFPLGIKNMPRVKLEPKEEVIAEKLEQLDEVENELYGVGRKLKQLNKRKRRKLLKSLDFQNVDEDNFDKVIEQAFPKNVQRKRKAREQLMNDWIEEEIDEDLIPKNKKAKKPKQEKSMKNCENSSQFADVEKQKTKEAKLLTVKKKSKDLLIAKNIETTEKEHSKLAKKEKKLLNNSHIEKQLTTENPLATQNSKAQKEEKDLESTNSLKTPPSKKSKQGTKTTAWDTPLADGEVEYFIPSRKLQMKKANSQLVLNPLAVKKLSAMSSPKAPSSPKTPASVKRVKIALKNNTEQKPSEYIRQVKCSPNLPFDANKKPGKGLLKPNAIPSPINPFYKKKIGLRLLNDTM